MTDQNNATQAAMQEAVRHALEIYAAGYDMMARIAAREGHEPVVSPASVAFDIRRNMVKTVVDALSQLRAEGVQAGDERVSLRGAANLAFNALHECKPAKGAEKQYSDAIQALQSALHDIAYTVNRTATPQQFADHLQREARAALVSAPVADTATIIREVCETDPAEDGPDTIRITVQDLTRIIDGYRAPVAGEALGFVAAAALETNFNDPDARIDMFKTDLGLLGYYHAATPVAVYAAPQASEAVRDAGIAASEDVVEKMREVLQWIVDDAASGGVAKLRPQQEKRARAALSSRSQPGRDGGKCA